MLVARNKEERRGEDNMRGKRKNGRRKGRGKRRGKGTYKAAMRPVFFPVILGVNVAPMAVMSFLRYSRASPMKFVTVISCEVVGIRFHILGEVANWKKVKGLRTCREGFTTGFFGWGNTRFGPVVRRGYS